MPIPPARHERQRVVVLEEELAARVEPQRPTARRIEQPPRTLNDEIHRLVPTGLDQLALAAHEWTEQPVGGVVRLPAVQALRAEPAVVDTVDLAAAHPDDPAVSHTDVKPAPVRAEWTRGLNPPIDRTVCELVDSNRPVPSPRVRRPISPRVDDRVQHCRSGYPAPDPGKHVKPVGSADQARASAFGWLAPGELRLYELSEQDKSRDWVGRDTVWLGTGRDYAPPIRMVARGGVGSSAGRRLARAALILIAYRMVTDRSTHVAQPN